ncbi:hypothetical protein [Streptomyces griseorubiginosus]
MTGPGAVLSGRTRPARTDGSCAVVTAATVRLELGMPPGTALGE